MAAPSPGVDRAAAVDCCSGEISAAEYSTRHRQVYDSDGIRLPLRRWAVEDAPQLATSSLWRLARERWVEVAP